MPSDTLEVAEVRLRIPTWAPHTAKIHTPITLGILRCAKLFVLKSGESLPCGFDSHRPLICRNPVCLNADLVLVVWRWREPDAADQVAETGR
jgi:hypothetical protein